MTVKDFRDLVVWQHAMDLVESVYQETQQFPPDELSGLTSQLRRAAVVIPVRIAEGHGRNAPKEFLAYLAYANSALCEVQTYILIAQRLNYLSNPHTERLLELCAEVARLINGLSNSLNKRL